MEQLELLKEIPGYKAILKSVIKSQIQILVGLIYENIWKTCPCNVYPLEPNFYIAKLGHAWVYLFFLFLLQNIDCGYSLEPPRRGGSNV